MSSPLDGRIRAIAREEAAALLGVGTPAPSTAPGPDQLAALQSEVAGLRARLDALEKTTGQTGQEDRPTARRTRKASE